MKYYTTNNNKKIKKADLAALHFARIIFFIFIFTSIWTSAKCEETPSEEINIFTENNKHSICDTLKVYGTISYDDTYTNPYCQWLYIDPYSGNTTAISNKTALTSSPSTVSYTFTNNDISGYDSRYIILALYEGSSSLNWNFSSDLFEIQKSILCGETTRLSTINIALCENKVLTNQSVTVSMSQAMNQDIAYYYSIKTMSINGVDTTSTSSNIVPIAYAAGKDTFHVSINNNSNKYNYYYVSLIGRDTIKADESHVQTEEDIYLEDFIFSDTLAVIRKYNITANNTTISVCEGEESVLTMTCNYDGKYATNGDTIHYQLKMKDQIIKSGLHILSNVDNSTINSFSITTSPLLITNNTTYTYTVFGSHLCESKTAKITPNVKLCDKNFFVRSSDGSDSDDGSSWEKSFQTISHALKEAYTLHQTKPTKHVNIYVATGQSEDYKIDKNGNKHDTLNYISIYGGFPITNTGETIDNANSITYLTKESYTKPTLLIGTGKNTLSRLQFSNNSNSRVLRSALNIEENLTISNCVFNSNPKGAIMLTSSSGGEIKIYDCKFTGNNQNSSTPNGGAIYAKGPYDIKIGTLLTAGSDSLPGSIINETKTNDACSSNKGISLSLIDPDDIEKVENYGNYFYDNANKNASSSANGGAIYISDAMNVEIKNAYFKENICNQNNTSFGCAIHFNNDKNISITHSYFTGNTNSNGITEGGAVYTDSVSNGSISYCYFYNNTIGNGNGGALSCNNSNIILSNSLFSNCYIKNSGFGGAFHVSGESTLNIINSKFEKNYTTNGSAQGGGAYVNGACVNVTNSVFVDNKAQVGGGFYIEGSVAYDSQTQIEIKNSLFTKNTSANGKGYGSAIAGKNMILKIKSSEFYDNNSAEGGCIHIEDGEIDIYSSSFNYNKVTNNGASALCITSTNLPSSSNVRIYNSTFSKNGGNQFGCIYLTKNNAEIISSTITDNTFTNDDAHGIICSGGSLKLMNSIVSNNGSSNKNRNIKINGNSSNNNLAAVLSSITGFTRNTIGSVIYGDGTTVLNRYPSVSCDKLNNTSCSEPQNLNCNRTSFSTSELSNTCTYGNEIAFTNPYEDTECRNYGLTLQELKAISDKPEIQNELLHDEHRSQRGWTRLCLTCDAIANDIQDTFRTFQGAVEGGKTTFEGNIFDLQLSRMVGHCSGGELSPAYIIINILDIGTDNSIADDKLTTLYDIDVKRIYTRKGVIDTVDYFSENPIQSLTDYYGNTCIYLDEVPTGNYIVTVNRKDANGILKERQTAAIEVESITEKAMTWVGGTSSDFNDLSNWKYIDENGDIVENKTVTRAPNACFDVHIGLEKADNTGKVSNLPTISSGKGECADIYFHPGGSLGKIHKLSYKRAHIEMASDVYVRNVSTDGKWKMISVPLKGMVSGDYMADNILAYIRYFNITHSNNTYTGTWTKSVANVGEDVSVLGMGYAFRCYKPNQQDTSFIFTFPKEDTSYEYGDGITETLDRTTTFRFNGENGVTQKIPDPLNIDISLTAREFPDASNQMSMNEAGGYVILGNPFMSHLDLDSFYAANKDIIAADIKLYAEGTFETYQVTSKISSNKFNRYVAPMQAFFIKPIGNALSSGKIELKIPSSCSKAEIEPDDESVYTLRSSSSVKNRIKIKATRGIYSSVNAIIIADKTATNGFITNEDSQKLIYASSSVDVYTHASKIPVDINHIDMDSLNGLTIPVTVSTSAAGQVTVKLTGIDGFEEATGSYWIDYTKNDTIDLSQTTSFTYSLSKGTTSDRFAIYFTQKERIKETISATVCKGDTFSYDSQTIISEEAGSFTHRLFIETETADPDTAIIVNMTVNPTYEINIKDSITEGESYDKNGFTIPEQSIIGCVYDTAYYTATETGCDSTVYLTLKVKEKLYDAIVYYGNEYGIYIQTNENGDNLKLPGNALAYFDGETPESLCKKTNVICFNNGNYEAKNIILSDSNDLYIPIEFNADSIQYTRKPAIYADYDNGWETIILPFTVTSFRNSGDSSKANGIGSKELIPFNKSDDEKLGDFWLKKISSSKTNGIGIDAPDAPILEANQPYLIAFPGSVWGLTKDLTGQTITYSSTLSKIASTPDPILAKTSHFSIFGTTKYISVDSGYYLNKEQNQFVYSDSGIVVAPFHAYATSNTATSNLEYLDIFKEDGDINTTSDKDFNSEGPSLFVVTAKDGILYIYSSIDGEAFLYNIESKVIRKIKYSSGKNAITELPTGVYIINNVEVIIR